MILLDVDAAAERFEGVCFSGGEGGADDKGDEAEGVEEPKPKKWRVPRREGTVKRAADEEEGLPLSVGVCGVSLT